MVAYSFKARFVAPIRAGLGLPITDEHYEIGRYIPGQAINPKCQTIRFKGRKRHGQPGETLQLYHAQRSPKCFKIGDARCKSVEQIRLWIRNGQIQIGNVKLFIRGRGADLDAFARDDGFSDWSDMRAFWLEEHEGKQLGPFVGLLIKWEAM